MWRLLPYVLKNLWRHHTRTVLTVSGAAVALFVFSFVGAVQEGLARLTSDRQADRTLIVFQANRFCPSTSKLPDHYADTIARLPGVTDVVPIKVFMNNCRASLDVVVFHGLLAEKVRSSRDLHLVAGDWDRFEQQRDAALVGQALAKRRNLSVGKKFSIGEVRVDVVGIFTSPQPAQDNFIYTHLKFLQETPGLNARGTVTQLEVVLTPSADADAVARSIDDTYRGGPVQTDTRPKGAFQSSAVGDLVELIRFARYLGFACLGLVLALVATTTMMAVQDRVREHAVLQTLGFSGAHIFTLVISESLLVGLAGGLLGISAALAALGWSGLAVGTEGVIIPFSPSVSLALAGLVVTVLVGAIAGLIPAWQAARADIVRSLRAV